MTKAYINQQEETEVISNPNIHQHFCTCCGKKETVDLRGDDDWRKEQKEKLWHTLSDNIHEYPSGLEHFDLSNAEVCDECYVKWLLSFKFRDRILIE